MFFVGRGSFDVRDYLLSKDRPSVNETLHLISIKHFRIAL